MLAAVLRSVMLPPACIAASLLLPRLTLVDDSKLLM